MKVYLENATYIYEGEEGRFVYFSDVESGFSVDSLEVPQEWIKLRTSDGIYSINPKRLAFIDLDEEEEAVIVAFDSVFIDEETESIGNALVFAREEDEEGYKRALELL